MTNMHTGGRAGYYMFDSYEMKRFTVNVIKVSKTGSDGGHLYLRGKTIWNGKDVNTFVFLKDKVEESKVKNMGEISNVVFCSPRYEFDKIIGLYIHEAVLDK